MPKPTNPTLQPGNPLASGLVRCYTFHEGAGATLHDLAPGGRHATARTAGVAAPANWGSDPAGAFISLDGTNQDARAADSGMPGGSSPRTLAFLARSTQPGDANIGYVLGYGDSGDGGMAFGHAGSVVQGQGRQVLWMTTHLHGIGCGPSMVDGAWHLCVATLDGSGTLRLYVDGQPAPILTDPASGASAQSVDFNPFATALPGGLYLGQAGGSPALGLYFRGDLAGAWAWDRALPPSDVASFAADPWQMVRAPGGAGDRIYFMCRKP